MFKFNAIVTISRKVDDDYIPLYKFSMIETPEKDAFMAVHEWVTANIEESDKENIYCEVEKVKQEG